MQIGFDLASNSVSPREGENASPASQADRPRKSQKHACAVQVAQLVRRSRQRSDSEEQRRKISSKLRRHDLVTKILSGTVLENGARKLSCRKGASIRIRWPQWLGSKPNASQLQMIMKSALPV